QAAVPDVAAAPSLRADRLERGEDHRALRHRPHHLRAGLPGDVEAAMSPNEMQMTFDVRDKRVTVAGAARSGIAAAELLARRGAGVTLSEARAGARGAGA